MAEAKKSINIPSIVNNYPQSASVISKLTKSDNQVKINPAEIDFKDISMSIKEKIGTNDDILDLFPDVELAIQILISSILSPNDMVNINLQYEAPKIALPSVVKQTLIDTIERHIEDEYDIVNKLPTILRESLFTKGAYIEAIIPEASLDDVINQYNVTNMSIENYLSNSKHVSKYLGKDNCKYGISIEEQSNPLIRVVDQNYSNKKFIDITQEDMCINITDNPNILLYSKKILEIKKKQASDFSARAMAMANESDDAILDKIFKSDTKLVFKEYIEVPTKDDASRESIGSPLVIKLPVESVVPIHATSDPSKHLGYFVLLDENGNPLNMKDGMMEYQEAMSNMTFLNNANSGSLIQKAKLALYGMSKDVPTIKDIEPIYNSIVENMIKNKLKNGMYGELVDIKNNADIFRVMLVRSLKAQQTKVLFLPEELVAYYAFEYRDNGTGKSLLEKNTLLYSIRAILLFARLMAAIKNSITNTVVSATLDEHDPDPESTREKIISESLKTRQSTIPLGLIRPDDLTEWTHKVGFLYKINHPALPNIELDVTDQGTSKIVPDEDLDNKLQERILMSYGLTPDIVMSGYQSDFATTVAAKNLLFAKRCTTTQLILMSQVTEHIKKIARNDFILVDKLTSIIKSNMPDIKKILKKSDSEEDDVNLKKITENKIVAYLLDKYINYITIKLPAIVFTDANSLRATFDAFSDNLTTYLDATITTSVFNDKYGGKLTEEIDNIKEVIKAMAIMKWANNNNFIPEINEMFTRDDEGNPDFDVFGEYVTYREAISDLFIPFVNKVGKSRKKTDEKITKALDELNEVGNDMGGDSSGDYSSDQPEDNSGGENDQNDTDSANMDDGGSDSTGDSDGGSSDMADMDSDTGGKGGTGGEETEEETSGEDLGSDEGSGEASGGSDDIGDMSMGDFGGGDESGGEKAPSQGLPKTTRSPNEVKINEELLAARVEKEKALAEKAKADAKKAKDEAGIVDEPEESEEQNQEEEQKDEEENSGETEQQEEQQESSAEDTEPTEQEDQEKLEAEKEKQRKIEEDQKRKEEEEQKKKEEADRAANEAYELDLTRSSNHGWSRLL